MSEQAYLDLLHDVLDNGERRGDRTGTGTIGVFGRQMRFRLDQEAPITRDEHGQPYLYFPLLTTKRVFWKGVVAELLWLISGETNIRPLVEQGVSIWTDWPLKKFNEHHKATGGEGEIDKATFEKWIRENEEFARDWGDLGPVYGAQWREWRNHRGIGIDQLADVIQGIKDDPFGRRHIVTAWNPADINRMALPPCHMMFQFHVSADGKLSCQLYQRSADLFLGVPFNIASYALLTRMVAQVCGLRPGEFIWTGGDCHIYQNHVEQVRTQLGRTPGTPPTLLLNPEITCIDYFTDHDILLEHYYPQASIKGEVSV